MLGHRAPLWVNLLIDSVTLLLLAAYSAVLTYQFFHRDVGPREVYSIAAIPAVIERGGEVTFRIHFRLHAICDAEIHRWIVEAETNTPVWARIEKTSVAKLGIHEAVYKVETDPNWEGQYYYRSVVYDTCDVGGGQSRTYVTSPNFIYFRVE
jgi:hypothetical protein